MLNDKRAKAFKDETYELLEELETALLDLEKSPDSEETIGRIFRAMHTIKGSGAMFGFDDISAFTHEAETVFDLVRNGKLTVSKELIDLILAVRDHIKTMVGEFDGGGETDKSRTKELTSMLKKLVLTADKQEVAEEDGTSEMKVEESQVTFRIRFVPPSDLFIKGVDPFSLFAELRQLGECRVIVQTEKVPLLKDLEPNVCYLYWDIILTTKKGEKSVKDVFFFVEKDCDLRIDVIDDGTTAFDIDIKRLGEILKERGDIDPGQLRKTLDKQKPLGELLVASKAVDVDKVESALAEQQHMNEIQKKRQNMDNSPSVRVASNKLDALVDLVGELVTVQARLNQTATAKSDPELFLIAEEVERLTSKLRDNTMSIRMLPIGTTFSKFTRLVRDLSEELGKEIDLTTEGAETELDKTVIEKLNEPMVHLIRNSIDHGIELPDVRKSFKKPGKGNVNLSASHSGANVLIRIKDDGKGLDPDAIRKKAIERGMISPDTELSYKKLFDLIMEPGFSTVDEVTNISGRGVGMDVVRRSIESLRGTIEINSQKNVGTEITMKLPLTLAIIDGLLVKIEKQYFVFPLSTVEECIELTPEDMNNTHGEHFVNVRDEIVPFIRLREHFYIDNDAPNIEQIVITEWQNRKIGFVVDHVIGDHQTVIKTLGRVYRDTEGISGATILGDGTVALILDVPKLIHLVEDKEMALQR